MTTIGFSPASVGPWRPCRVVPVLEVPSRSAGGSVESTWRADPRLDRRDPQRPYRWSQSVAVYMVSAGFLGVFFALQSGTLESVVYDTVLEETGGSDAFEKTRSGPAGGERRARRKRIGGRRSPPPRRCGSRFLTAPLLAGAGAAAAVPGATVAEAEAEESLRGSWPAPADDPGSGRLRAVVALTVAGSVLMQGMLEFGPSGWSRWPCPPSCGPHWAGLLGARPGRLLKAQAWITRPWAVGPLAIAITAAASSWP